jgi:hypothetical protein
MSVVDLHRAASSACTHKGGADGCGDGLCGAGARRPHVAGQQRRLQRQGAWCRSASPLRRAGIGWRHGAAGQAALVCCNGREDDLLKVGGGTDGDGSLLGGGYCDASGF